MFNFRRNISAGGVRFLGGCGRWGSSLHQLEPTRPAGGCGGISRGTRQKVGVLQSFFLCGKCLLASKVWLELKRCSSVMLLFHVL